MKIKSYINTKFKPSREHLIAEFSLYPRKISFRRAAEEVAAESSIGTWTDLTTLTPSIAKKLKPTIFYLNKKTHTIRIAYPCALFEKGSIPQLMSSIGGNIFGMNCINGLRLEDIDFPDSYVKSFKGPKHGIKGVRKILKIKDRPLVGTIVKPKVGLTSKQHARVAFDAWVGGCDIVKDDENLSSMDFNKFDKRVKETLKLRKKAEKITGEKKVYMPNVTAETNEMLRRARLVKKFGGRYAMVDIVTIGWSGLQTIANANLGLVLHAHRAGHAAFTRDKRHGISMLVLAKLCRLIGLDQIHVGAIVGKMEGGKKEVQHIGEEIEHSIIHPDKKHHVLAENWFNLKPMFAVCSGGLHPGKVPPLVKAMGKDIIIQFGGGIHGHPQGTKAGAKAALQAVHATMNKVDLHDYARFHPELKAALKKWGM